MIPNAIAYVFALFAALTSNLAHRDVEVTLGRASVDADRSCTWTDACVAVGGVFACTDSKPCPSWIRSDRPGGEMFIAISIGVLDHER